MWLINSAASVVANEQNEQTDLYILTNIQARVGQEVGGIGDWFPYVWKIK